MDRYEDDYDSPTRFHVQAITVHYSRDNDRYIRERRRESMTLSAGSLDELYTEMARYRMQNIVETHGMFMERSEVEFETIYESVAEGEVDMSRVEQTDMWKAHVQAVEARRVAEAEKLAREEAAKAAKVEQNEKELLASLLAKHGAP